MVLTISTGARELDIRGGRRRKCGGPEERDRGLSAGTGSGPWVSRQPGLKGKCVFLMDFPVTLQGIWRALSF